MAQVLTAVHFEGVTPAVVIGEGPKVRRTDPRALLVNDSYQREINKAGLKLIAKIVENFSWAKYKLPTVVETDEGLIVIDGQHTAIACASIPSLREIPVAIVGIASTEEQALAFLGINRDRLAVTNVQLHHAAAAGGDQTARAVNEVCRQAGVTLLRSQRGPKMYSEGETIAVRNISNMIRDFGTDHAVKVLTLCRKARLAPISQAYIRAVSTILTDEEKMALISEDILLVTLRQTRATIDKDVRTWAAEYDAPYFKALASVLFKAARNQSTSIIRERLMMAAE